MEIDEEVLKLFEDVRKNGIKTTKIIVKDKVFNIETDVYNMFIKNCEETVEAFLERIQPEDDDEASYLMSRYINNLLEEGKRKF